MRSVKLLSIILLAFAFQVNAQYVQPMRYPHYSFTESVNIGVGTVRTTNASAYLEIGPISGGTKGFLPPRLSTTQRDAIVSPAAGLMVFNTTTSQYNFYNGTSWTTFSSGAGGGGGISSLGTGWGLASVNDSTYRVDTALVPTFWRFAKVRDSLGAIIGTKLAISDTAGKWIGSGWLAALVKYTDTTAILANYVRAQRLADTAAAIRAAIGSGGGGVTGTGTNLQVALWNGTSTVTGHQRYTWTNSNDYPSLIIGAGTGATYGASIQLRNAAGTYSSITSDGGPQSYYGSSTYRSHNFYDYAGGAGLLARFYSASGTKYADIPGLAIFSSLVVPSNEQGAVTISRTVPYAPTGNNYHGFTDQTIWRLGNEAFNSFGSFVKMGNNRTDFNHYAAFQAVWQKDSTNKVGTIYDFVSAVSTMTGGTIDTLSRFEAYDVTKTGGTIGKQYGIKIRNLTSASTNIGAWIYNNVGIGPTAHTPTERLVVDGNIWATGTLKTANPGSGAGAWKLGTYISSASQILDTDHYVETEIGGQIVRLAVYTIP